MIAPLLLGLFFAGLLRVIHLIAGELLRVNWKVIYPDGLHSRAMRKEIATSYAKMFGGYAVPTHKEIYDWGLR